MIRIRMHRGGLKESMDTMRECQSKYDVFDYLMEHGVSLSLCRCEKYCDEGDDRIGWKQVFIIMGRFKEDTSDAMTYPLAFSDVWVDFIS